MFLPSCFAAWTVTGGSVEGSPTVVGTTSGTDIDDLRAACQELCDAVGARRVAVWVHDDRAGAVSPLVAVGADVHAPYVARRWARLPVRAQGEPAYVRPPPTEIRVGHPGARA